MPKHAKTHIEFAFVARSKTVHCYRHDVTYVGSITPKDPTPTTKAECFHRGAKLVARHVSDAIFDSLRVQHLETTPSMGLRGASSALLSAILAQVDGGSLPC